MPAGLPYFAWVDASETTFGAEHMRWDEAVFSFNLAQEEGDPASLTAVVRRPDPLGLLGPGRKIWAWFALDCGPALIKFRGRLVGIPTSIFEELVTLEFVARPVDVVAQKEALAETLRVLPYYDEAMIDKARRDDPDVVLEGYTKIWHFDRETHVVTVSDEITGEDGLVEFDGASEDGKVLYDGLGLSLASGPLARVDMSAEFTWTQQGFGIVDLTNYLVSNWPGASNGIIRSWTVSAGDWPKVGATLGEGWIAVSASAHDLYDFTTESSTGGSTLTVKSEDSSRTSSVTNTRSYLVSDPPLLSSGKVTHSDNVSTRYAKDGDGRIYMQGYSRSISTTEGFIAMQAIKPTLVAGYDAQRECTERVTFSLYADVQPILTDPEDGEALRIDDIKSVNLSDPEEGTLIGDARRRSYIATERGNRSIEYLLVLARAHLMKRARVVEIAFAPKLSRMPEVTLRKNAFLVEPRVGEALGKIIAYSIALDGNDGRVNCEIRIGCTIGRGGSAVADGGLPTYCSTDYVGFDYQQFTGRTILFDTSVAYQPPNADPNDDGVELLSVLRVEDVLEQPLTVEFGPEEQEDSLREKLQPFIDTGLIANPHDNTSAVAARQQAISDMMRTDGTRAKFKLKSMTRAFSTDYELQVSDLNIPTGYDLEAG